MAVTDDALLGRMLRRALLDPTVYVSGDRHGATLDGEIEPADDAERQALTNALEARRAKA